MDGLMDSRTGGRTGGQHQQCKVALRQGRYQVLREIAKCVEDKRKASRPNGPLQKKIQFVKAGEKLSITERDQLPGYFDNARLLRSATYQKGKPPFEMYASVTFRCADTI